MLDFVSFRNSRRAASIIMYPPMCSMYPQFFLLQMSNYKLVLAALCVFEVTQKRQMDDVNGPSWMHEIDQTSNAMVSSWQPFKQMEFYQKALLFGNRISHLMYLTYVTCALWRVSLWLHRNGKKGNMRKSWVKSSTLLWPTLISSSLQTIASTTSPGTWPATPRGYDHVTSNLPL